MQHKTPSFDFITLIAISLLAYLLSVALHEHAGHALACWLLGGKVTEFGAYYVNFKSDMLSDFSMRVIALAGIIVDFATGFLGWYFIRRLPKTAINARYFAWLFGTISVMTGAGYFLFSGATGIGDLGMTRDGALYQANPEWLWRIVIFLAGVVLYTGTIMIALRFMEKMIGGSGPDRVKRAQILSLSSYLTGSIAAILIGFLNPHGVVIVIISAAASSLGGTSGLAWMMQFLNRKTETTEPLLELPRSWGWIGVGILFTIVYAAVFGPTFRN